MLGISLFYLKKKRKLRFRKIKGCIKITRSSQDLPLFNYNFFCLDEDRIMYFSLDEQLKSLAFGGHQI